MSGKHGLTDEYAKLILGGSTLDAAADRLLPDLSPPAFELPAWGKISNERATKAFARLQLDPAIQRTLLNESSDDLSIYQGNIENAIGLLKMPIGLAASFTNGIVIEIGRKLRQPADEEPGVETYSRLWGKSAGAVVWIIALATTLVFATMAASKIHFATPVLIVLSIAFLIAIIEALRYRSTNRSGKIIETLSGLWTLALYLTLGLVPLITKNLPPITDH